MPSETTPESPRRLPFPPKPRGDLQQGLRVNLPQFTLQMALIFSVGATIGTQRTVVSLIADTTFGISNVVYISSFVISFGLVKAILNLVGGRLSELFGRRPLMIAGWVAAIPIPLLIIAAPTWGWIVAANILLGINQGLCWSMSVNAKIDLVGARRRGLAVGLDESAGYLGVAVAALLTGHLAGAYGLRPVPFQLALGVIILALGLSILLMEETLPYTRLESKADSAEMNPVEHRRSFTEIFALASYRHKSMFSISQAGFVEKFVDALVWIIYPLYLAQQGLPVAQIGAVVFAYGVAWGLLQIPAGQLADVIGRKPPIVTGMLLCGLGVLGMPLVGSLGPWLAIAAVTGVGMALLYPNLMTAAADTCHPSWRATGLGVYRFWRDGGYAVGALFVGIVANGSGLSAAFFGVAAAMVVSAAVLMVLMAETRPQVR